ncbi:MAG: twin-arginine translocation pathway signal protein [Caldimonas sp.]
MKIPPTRRGFMLVLAAGGAIVALPGCDSMPASAVQAWQGPPASETDARLRVLSWAMLAPNPHNLQAWIADAREADTIKLYVDPTRLLPQTDPPGRQVLIGCGAFLELLRMAAAQEGWLAQIDLLPDGDYPAERIDSRPFAIVRLRKDAAVEPDPLFAAVKLRRTTRSPYEPRVPDQKALTLLRVASQGPGISFHAETAPERVARLSEIAIQGYQIEFNDAAAWGESAHVARIGAAAVSADPSGITLLGTEVWFGRQLGMLTPAKMTRTDGIGAQRAIQSSTEAANSTRAWVWLASTDNSRRTQLLTGRSYLRLNLQATVSGLALQPNSQALQEFSAMDEVYAALHREVNVSAPARVQMFARLGYAALPEPAPRRAAERILRA